MSTTRTPPTAPEADTAQPLARPAGTAPARTIDSESRVLQQLLSQPEFLIRRAHQLASSAFAQACADLELTPSQFAALFALRQQQQASQNELGRMIALDRSTTSVVLRSLKERGLVASSADAHDRRKTVLSLTDAGRLLLAQAEQRSAQSSASWLAKLGERESAEFLEMLRRLARAAD